MTEESGDPVTPTAFGIQKSQTDPAIVLAVSGEVDMLTAPQLAEAIQTALAAGPRHSSSTCQNWTSWPRPG